MISLARLKGEVTRRDMATVQSTMATIRMRPIVIRIEAADKVLRERVKGRVAARRTTSPATIDSLEAIIKAASIRPRPRRRTRPKIVSRRARTGMRLEATERTKLVLLHRRRSRRRTRREMRMALQPPGLTREQPLRASDVNRMYQSINSNSVTQIRNARSSTS